MMLLYIFLGTEPISLIECVSWKSVGSLLVFLHIYHFLKLIWNLSGESTSYSVLQLYASLFTPYCLPHLPNTAITKAFRRSFLVHNALPRVQPAFIRYFFHITRRQPSGGYEHFRSALEIDALYHVGMILVPCSLFYGSVYHIFLRVFEIR